MRKKRDYTKTVTVNGIRTYISIKFGESCKYGKISIRGEVIADIVADKLNKKWIYVSSVSGERINKYDGMTPQKFAEALENESKEEAAWSIFFIKRPY